MLIEQIAQLQTDLASIREAIAAKGQEVTRGTPLSEWAQIIDAIKTIEDKSEIIAALGDPAATGDTVSALAGHITTTKAALAQNLTARGWDTSPDIPLLDMARRVWQSELIAGDIPHLWLFKTEFLSYNMGVLALAAGSEMLTSVSGTVRISFELYSAVSAEASFACIYKNGIAAGTPQVVNSTVPQTFTEDLPMQAGDVFSLYARRTNNPAKVKNLKYMFSVPVFVSPITLK